jgi:hypothetical protein
MDSPTKPESGNHAWRTGLLIGTMLRHGMNAEVVYVPGSQDYSTTIKVTLDMEGVSYHPPMEILIKVINNSDDDGHD